MEFFIYWIIGWIIMSIGTYIYNVYIDNDNYLNKKANIWRAFWRGIFSWFGIIICISFWITGFIALSYDYIEDKLNHI